MPGGGVRFLLENPAEHLRAKSGENKFSEKMQKDLAIGPARLYSPLSRSQYPSRQSNKMSKPQENSKQEQEVQTIAISKEAMEKQQEVQSEAIGCKERKAVSGFEYLVIYTRALVALGILPKENLGRALEAAKGMKANNSALRQWLYERSEKTAKTSAIADKYLSM